MNERVMRKRWFDSCETVFFLNKQHKTVDNSFMLLYTVYTRRAIHDDYYK